MDALRFAGRALPGWCSERVRADPGTACSAPFYGVLLKGDSNNSQAMFMTERERKKKVFHQLLQLLFQKVLLGKDPH